MSTRKQAALEKFDSTDDSDGEEVECIAGCGQRMAVDKLPMHIQYDCPALAHVKKTER